MKKNNMLHTKILLTVIILVTLFFKISGQTQVLMPDVLTKNTMNEQLKYLEDHTKIFENYRAIREDMFQKIKKNISDTLAVANSKVPVLNKRVQSLAQTIDSLNRVLAITKTSLENEIDTKNSVRVLGVEVSKMTYNTIMWLIVIGLSVILVIGSLIFKKNMSSTLNIEKELKELKDEFEAYRKTTREAREKISMAHFNEIRKLKGG